MSSEYNQAIQDLLQDEEKWSANPQPVWGLKTGEACYDVGLGGLHGGELVILAARPSHGKSTLANQMAFNIANRFKKHKATTGENLGKVLVFSPEMTMKSILMRQACSITAVSSRSLKTGTATAEERETWHEAMDVLGELEQHIFVAGGRPIHINDVESITAQYDKHVRFIVVDYITQLIGDKKHRSRHEEVHDIALRLKNIAMEYDVPVMALSQLSRDVEKDAGGDDIDRPPKVSDLRASGGIEETSDVVLLLQRQRQTANQGNFGVSANLEIGKNRDGPVGFITMNFNTRYNRFDDIGVNRGLNLEGV